MKLLVVFVIAEILASAIGGWTFMLSVGVAHANWVPMLPTIGFETAATISGIGSAPVILVRLFYTD
jgi:uncharacterized membrane protein